MKRIILFLFLLTATGMKAEAQALLLSSPDGSSVWPGGTKQLIKWTYSNLNNIKIEYSLDNAQTWQNITSAIPASAREFEWAVPETPSNNCFIKITDLEDATVYSINALPFIIPPTSLQWIPFYNTTTLSGNSIINIRWKAASISNVNISYTVNGSTWNVIANNVPASRGYYNWGIPNINAAAAKVKIQSAADALVFVESTQYPIAAMPAIQAAKYYGGAYDGHSMGSSVAKALTILSPVLNDTFNTGAAVDIKWKTFLQTVIHIAFSADSGTTWTPINTVQAGILSHKWNVPASPSDKCLVRITDNDGLTVVSPVFVIRERTLAIKQFADQKVVAGGIYSLKWDQTGVSKVNLYYAVDGSFNWQSIAQAQDGIKGYYFWKAPATFNSAYLKIEAADNAALFSITTEPVSIQQLTVNVAKYYGGSFDGADMGSNKALLKVKEPAKGANLAKGSSGNITWESLGVSAINIYFSADSGNTWASIATNLPAGTMKYNWQVPDRPTKQGRIKIEDTFNENIFALSDSTFQIYSASLKVNYPYKTTIIRKNTVLPIRWSNTGVDSVAIAYSADNGTSWKTIAPSVSAKNLVFNWKADGPLDTLLKIRINDKNFASTGDTTAAIVRIEPEPVINGAKYYGGSYDGHATRSNLTSLLLKAPTGGEVIKAGNTYSIKWSAYNLTDSVKIELSLDSGVTWQTIVHAPAVQGSYDWLVGNNLLRKPGNSNGREPGDSINSKCRIRVSGLNNDADVIAMNKQSFTIATENALKPVINVKSPVKADTLFADRTYAITWESFNIAGTVSIDMSVDSGATYTNIAQNITNTGTYNWTVPNRLSYQKPVGKGAFKVYSAEVTALSEIFTWKQQVVTAVIDVERRFELNAFPNPATSFVYLHGKFERPQDFTVTITDINGKVFYQQNYKNISQNWLQKLYLQQFSAGMKYVTFTFKDGKPITIPIIIIK